MHSYHFCCETLAESAPRSVPKLPHSGNVAHWWDGSQPSSSADHLVLRDGRPILNDSPPAVER